MGTGDEREVGSLARVLSDGLPDVLPGLSVVDRELALTDELRADLLCVDEDGRTTLVLVVPGRGEAPVLACLDALIFGRRNAALLARHVSAASAGCEPLSPELEPRAVLVAERFDPLAVARLSALGEERVALLELRTLSSASGERHYLVRVGEGESLSLEEPAAPLERFTSSLGEGQGELVHSLLARMGRMDEELRARMTPRSITWSFRDVGLARLESAGGELRGSVPPFGEPHFLLDARDADAFLEAAMERYARCLGLLEDEGAVAGPPGGQPGGQLGDSNAELAGEAGDEPEEEPAEGWLRTVLDPRSGPILTEEELEAFRE